MGKKSRKQAAVFEKNQSGCMRGLISMFDFRHVHSTQKLLPDRKRGSRLVKGTADELEVLENSCEICRDINGGEQSESTTVDAGKMSVKELMEEEMIVEEDKKKQATGFAGDPNQTVMACGGRTRKSRTRTGKKSFDLGDANLFGAEDGVSERPVRHEHKSSKSLDLSAMMEELCGQMLEKNIYCFKHNHENELQTQSSDQDSSVLKQKLVEATKVFVDHFTDEKGFRNNGKIHSSKELLEALQILNSNKEVFLKLLHDPNSQLMKHMQNLEDFQVEKDGNSKEFLEEDTGDGKHESFFWRKLKGLERSFSKRHDNPHDINRIIVLKPGSPYLHSLKPAAIHSSLQQSPQNTGNIVSSNFSFTEFKRRLKYAMRKEQPDSRDFDKANKTVGGENGGVPSPGRDHFFIERKPKPSSSINKGDKIAKSEESTGHKQNDTAFTDQRVPNIYFEAKKQLAEIVSHCDADVDFSSRKVPKSLGRIMAFPGYSSPICSPRKEGDLSFTTAESRLSAHGECRTSNENACHQVQEINADHQDSVKQVTEGESCMTAGKVDNEVVAPDSGEDASAEQEVKLDLGPDRDFNSVGDDEADVKIVMSSNAAVQEQCNNLDTSSGQCSPLITIDDTLGSCEEKGQSAFLELDTVGEDEPSSSPMTSASDCWHAKEVEDLDITTDRAGQPSPISVLGPIFRDDVSPPGIGSLPVGESIGPLQIQFEEQISPPSHIVAYIKTCGEDKRSIFEFIQVLVQKSCLTWDELLRRFLLSDRILDITLFDEVESLQDRLCEDPRLLFDLIDEVLLAISWHNFGSILSFAKPFVQPEEKGKDVIVEVWERVDWYFQRQGPCTLEEIVVNDYSKSWGWMDLRRDIESLGIEIEETILEEVVEDAILNFIGGSQGSEFPALSDDSKES